MRRENAPLEYIVAAWPDAESAGQAMDELKQAKKDHLVGIVELATIVVDDDGKMHLTDVKDMGPGKGAVVGGVLGAGLGLVTGGVGWLLMGGGALGALAARARDGGLPDDRLRAIGERMTPNSSAIVAVIEHKWAADLEREVAAAGADVVTEAIGDDIAEQLASGSSVSYNAAEVDGDVVASRTSTPAETTRVEADPKTPAEST